MLRGRCRTRVGAARHERRRCDTRAVRGITTPGPRAWLSEPKKFPSYRVQRVGGRRGLPLARRRTENPSRKAQGLKGSDQLAARSRRVSHRAAARVWEREMLSCGSRSATAPPAHASSLGTRAGGSHARARLVAVRGRQRGCSRAAQCSRCDLLRRRRAHRWGARACCCARHTRTWHVCFARGLTRARCPRAARCLLSRPAASWSRRAEPTRRWRLRSRARWAAA